MLATDNVFETSSSNSIGILSEIERLDERLHKHFRDQFIVKPSLSRSLVSFQANKTRPIYRWYKYKEAFSASLVEYFLNQHKIDTGTILDPFAGSGTALFAAATLGLNADGIELLPIGQQIIAVRRLLEDGLAPEEMGVLRRWATQPAWKETRPAQNLSELRITKGAYSTDTQKGIEKYLSACAQENSRVQAVLRFALLCVLEVISYTRKDGQYLRWDYRSGRRQGKKPFDKGEMPTFEQAITAKLKEILVDLAPPQQGGLFPAEGPPGNIRLHEDSCLQVLPELPSCSYEAIITSPPYCNRYDYTRTYALELALLGIDEQGLVDLRQAMLSCTVENRAKDLLKVNPQWAAAINVADNQKLLQAILNFLARQKAEGILNNNGIPRMIRGYFYEMACVIAECCRVLKANAPLIMVNDNVRYAGASISVDMILSEFAEKLGFCVENILVLPKGKGNSSQQMGEHGRKALRKCVYVWRKL